MGKTICLLFATALLLVGCRTTTEPLTGTWQSIAQLPTDAYYSKISFTNQLNGWVVGHSGRVLHTTDGGYNWQSVQTGTTRDFHCLVFVDDQTGWIAGQRNTIIRTTDGGNSWELQTLAPDTLHRVLAMSFIDRQQGWVASNYGEIFHTTDGGTTWSAQQSGTQWGLISVHFVDQSNGWATCVSKTVLRTTDSGANWESVDITGISSPIMCTDLAFIDKQRGWITTTVAASSSIQTGSPLLFTQDGGSTWSQQALLPSMILTSVEVVYPDFAWVGGDNKIFFTGDGGTTWASQYENDGEVYVSISFTDLTHGWALGFNGNVLRYEALPMTIRSY